MNHHEIEQRLNDYVDGSLSEKETMEVARHVSECADCATICSELEILLSQAKRLPRTLEPRRDLWPEIEARIQRRPHAETKRPRWRLASSWIYGTSLAAVAAVLLLLLVPKQEPGTEPRESAMPIVRASRLQTGYVPALVHAFESECLGAGRQLQASILESENPIGTAAALTIEADLKVIDTAIEETRNALLKNPEDPDLMRIMTARYQQKLTLLQHAMRLAGEV